MSAKSVSVFKPAVSFKYQTLAALLATVAAVILPQLCHMAGAALGVGSNIGEVLLPMHLPVMLVGFIAGPYAGAAAGVLSPVLSFMLTGMPKMSLLPFMIIELFAYGFVSGLLKNVKLNSVLKVISVQLAGRALRAAAIILGAYCFKSVIPVSIIYTSIVTGVAGILLQLIVIPFSLSGLKKLSKNEK